MIVVCSLDAITISKGSFAWGSDDKPALKKWVTCGGDDDDDDDDNDVAWRSEWLVVMMMVMTWHEGMCVLYYFVYILYYFIYILYYFDTLQHQPGRCQRISDSSCGSGWFGQVLSHLCHSGRHGEARGDCECRCEFVHWWFDYWLFNIIIIVIIIIIIIIINVKLIILSIMPFCWYWPPPGHKGLRVTTGLDTECHPSRQHPLWSSIPEGQIREDSRGLCTRTRSQSTASWGHDGNWREGWFHMMRVLRIMGESMNGDA